MQQAIPCRPWHPLITHSLTTTPIHNNNNNNNNNNSHFSFVVSPKMVVHNMVSQNAVIVFGRRGCCMSHVVKRLLLGLGVNPAVHEVEEKDEVGVVKELEAIVGVKANATDDDADDDGKKVMMQFPAVFIGGKLFGGLERVMATHISGELVPILKQAGALWL